MATAIKDLISTVMHKDKSDWRYYLLNNWQTIIGPIHTRICLEKIQNDILVIGVYESHWMQELYLLSNLMIGNINKHFDEPKIKGLRFKLIELKGHVKTKIKEINVQDDSYTPLTHAQKIALIKINDNELKEFLSSFWQRCVREI